MKRRALLLALPLAIGWAQPQPEFEVASVKPWTPSAGPFAINLGVVRHGKVTLTNVTLTDCIRFAYDIASDSQISGPDWIKSKTVRFVIVAQAPPDTNRQDALRMLQTLLGERFKMTLHREKRELPFYALVVGKGGPKLHAAKPGEPYHGNVVPGSILHNQLPLSVLAMLLSRFELQRPVLNMTGLEGAFDVKMEWTPERIQRIDRPEAKEPDSGPTLFTAIQEQLGLKLEARKGPVEVLVVDHADQVPTEN